MGISRISRHLLPGAEVASVEQRPRVGLLRLSASFEQPWRFRALQSKKSTLPLRSIKGIGPNSAWHFSHVLRREARLDSARAVRNEAVVSEEKTGATLLHTCLKSTASLAGEPCAPREFTDSRACFIGAAFLPDSIANSSFPSDHPWRVD